jgi:ribose 5-phosphate isomerase B
MNGIIIGNDSKSINSKKNVIEICKEMDIIVNDVGTNDMTPIDYPDITLRAMENILRGISGYALIISENGNEMMLSASTTQSIRPIVCRTAEDAIYGRQKLNGNVFCIQNDMCKNKELISDIINNIMTVEFDEGVHSRRLGMIGRI